VREFIDVVGASGDAYRFHRADLAGLPHLAGNFLFTRVGLDGPAVVGCGSSNDLSVARRLWSAAKERFADAVYLRLDIVRHRRSDVAARHQPAIVAEEFDRTGQAQISAVPEPKSPGSRSRRPLSAPAGCSPGLTPWRAPTAPWRNSGPPWGSSGADSNTRGIPPATCCASSGCDASGS
jgi:hypothetical protein